MPESRSVDSLVKIIDPIIAQTYGNTHYSQALTRHIAVMLPDWEKRLRGRQHEIMLACWDWFSSGTTAESVAAKIETALEDSLRHTPHLKEGS